ncbi:hypothetical protein K7H20_02685 [Salipiger manganoxidans]|uniref:hypothetical protein n=1 Tax=Salipiger marinus TaxID=555512 RepID=UPI001E2B1A2B|nr:hypothetical protein [Salipiger manganoxidans]MCD1616946.1 hypothetical protein [Salipiger manganoxidans]
MNVIRIMLQDIRRNLPFLCFCISLLCCVISGAFTFAYLGLDPVLGSAIAIIAFAIGHPLWLWAASTRRRAKEDEREWEA